MIGLGVKVQIRRAFFGRLNSLHLLLFSVVVVIASCSGAPAKPSKATEPVPPEPQPGASRWAGDAMLLPADTPMVLVARLGDVLDAGSRLRKWLVAEPAMFGENGEDTARSITFGWQAATAYLGLDPFEPAAWAQRGIDPTRPLHAAVYPLGDDGKRFVSAVETDLRHTLGLPPGEGIGPSARTLANNTSAFPEGTNSVILRTVEGLQPVSGLRVVVPITSRSDFSTTFTSFAEGMGFVPIPAELAAERPELDIAMWSPTGGSPAAAVRLRQTSAVVDVLFPVFSGGALSSPDIQRSPEKAWAELGRALDEVPSGRPMAPRPVHAPALSVSFDQAAMAEWVKLRGYRATLEELQTVGAASRDELLLAGVTTTISEAEIWNLASDELTGTSFELEVGPATSNNVGRASMTLFSKQSLGPIDAVPALPTLGIDDRSAALGVTLESLREDAWRSWFSKNTSKELRAVDFGPTDIVRVGLPTIRLMTIAGSNLGDPQSVASLSKHLAGALREFEGVRRFEVVGLSANVSDFRRNPRLLAAFVLAKDEPIATAELARHEFRRALVEWFEAPAPADDPPLMKAGVSGETAVDSIGTLRHHVVVGDAPVALFGVGLSAEDFEAELASLRAKRADSAVVQGRLEPITLLTWVRLDDPERFAPLDLDILAQRMGPIRLRYESTQVEDGNGVTLELSLDTPPKL